MNRAVIVDFEGKTWISYKFLIGQKISWNSYFQFFKSVVVVFSFCIFFFHFGSLCEGFIHRRLPFAYCMFLCYVPILNYSPMCGKFVACCSPLTSRMTSYDLCTQKEGLTMDVYWLPIIYLFLSIIALIITLKQI